MLSDLPAEVLAQRPAAGADPGATDVVPTSEVSGDVVSLARALFRWARADSKLKLIPTVERELVVQALNETQGNQVQAAKLLGVTRATLRKRVEKFGIKQDMAIK